MLTPCRAYTRRVYCTSSLWRDVHYTFVVLCTLVIITWGSPRYSFFFSLQTMPVIRPFNTRSLYPNYLQDEPRDTCPYWHYVDQIQFFLMNLPSFECTYANTVITSLHDQYSRGSIATVETAIDILKTLVENRFERGAVISSLRKERAKGNIATDQAFVDIAIGQSLPAIPDHVSSTNISNNVASSLRRSKRIKKKKKCWVCEDCNCE